MKTAVSLATLAILAAIALAGCSPGDPTAGQTGSRPVSTATESTPTSVPNGDGPVADPDVLFSIFVTATSPSGAVADLVQTVYRPVAATTQQSADEAALDGECDGWRSEYAAAEYVVGLIDITDRSPAGSSWDRSVAVVSMNGWPVFSGEVDTFQSYCASYQVNLGSSRGVTPIAAGAGADGTHGWAHIEYGFGIATEAGTDVPGPNDTVLSDCVIILGAEAQASAIASTWVSGGDPLGCMFGQYDH